LNTDTNNYYKRFIVLYVDDEENSLDSLKIALDDTFDIITATGAAEGYRILQEQGSDIGVLMTDQRMPGESGTQFLEKARALHPGIMRILVTAYSDISAAIDAVNAGAIYKYVSKPWDVRDLEITLKRALEYFQLLRERDELLRDKLSVTYSMVIADRIMMLGLIGAGLNEKFRNAPAAVRSYLEFVGNGLRRDSISIEHLKEISVWERFHKRAVADAEVLARTLDSLTIRTASDDDKEIKAVSFAVTTAEEIGLVLDNDGGGDGPVIAAAEDHVKQLFKFIWKTLTAVSAKDCKLSFGDGRTIEITSMIPDAAGAGAQFLFNPFASDDPENTAEIGATLLAAFVIAYHLGIQISGTGLADGEARIYLKFSGERIGIPSAAAQLDQALINETLWERIID
jgi:two-component system probable response regulator PhcQ